ncbi:hypothetical protein HPB47_026261 [Ixodes persulcatus]|uniref:Uncharacterized protein n=1 Tax=Ixodes persulcatus TaxID=34615 RepID=A0AC60Q109_IXOPE|nr:hypothetical protein HPB47_026261 [Ixodes persulcatus]
MSDVEFSAGLEEIVFQPASFDLGQRPFARCPRSKKLGVMLAEEEQVGTGADGEEEEEEKNGIKMDFTHKNVQVTCSRNGWLTTPVFFEWVRGVWCANKDDVRRLLVLDQAPIHKTEAEREALEGKETNVVFIPGAVTAKENLKKPSRQDVVSFVSEARASLLEEAILTSFKRCGISTSLNGSEDGELNHRLASVSDEPAMGPEARESTVDDEQQQRCVFLWI